MIGIYELDQFDQWTGARSEIAEADGCAPTWARAPEPPEVGEGEAAVWAIGKWYVLPRLNADDISADAPPLEPA